MTDANEFESLNLDDAYDFFSEEYFSPEDFEEFQERYEANQHKLPSEVLATIIIQAIIVFIGITANIIVTIVTIFGNNRQESSTITYVTNLSISNIVFLATVPFRLVEDVYLGWPFGLALCQITTFIKYLNFTLVVFFLMVMGIDRYLAVNRPLTSSHMRSVRVSRIASVVLWILSTACALPLALHYWANPHTRCIPKFPGQIATVNLSTILNENKTFDAPTMCEYPSWATSFTIWTVTHFFYSFFIQYVVIVICYAAIIRRIRTPSSGLGKLSSKGHYNDLVKKKVTQMSVLLVISYSVCYIPYYAWVILKLVGVPVSNIATCSHVERFSTTMAYVNSALHPILYICASGQFNKQYQVVKWKLGCRRTAYGSHQNSLLSNTKRTIVKSNGSTYHGEARGQLKQPFISDTKSGSTPTAMLEETNSTSV